MLRYLSLATAFLLIAFLPKVHAAGFEDVAGTRYSDAYSALSVKGAIQNTDGRPFAMITRAEALKVIVEMRPELSARARALAGHLPPIALFEDMNQRAWYAPYVEAAFEARLITGFPDHLLRPGEAIHVEEAIALLLRAYGDAPRQNGSNDPQWYIAPVTQAFEKNIISPRENLHLGDTLTRGQFFDMAYRLDTIHAKRLTAFIEPVWNAQQVVAELPPVVKPTQPIVAETPPAVKVTPPRVVITPASSSAAPVTQTQPKIAQSSSVPPASVAQTPTPVTPSEKPFAITIPALGITDLTITHPQDPTTSQGLLSVLTNGVGHLFGYPGNDGKIMIYGHSSGYAWDVSKYTKIFRTVNKLQVGDRVYVTYKGTLFTYEVSSKETVPANSMDAFRGGGEELILYTCWPPDSIKERYLVHAVPVSNAVAGR